MAFNFIYFIFLIYNSWLLYIFSLLFLKYWNCVDWFLFAWVLSCLVYTGCVSVLLKLTNICFIIFVDFGVYLLDCIYSRSYCTSYTFGCCYLLSIFHKTSVSHSLLFLVMMFSVHQVTKYVVTWCTEQHTQETAANINWYSTKDTT